MSDHAIRSISVYVVVATAAAFVLAPLVGLAWFATPDGAEALDVGTVAAWAEPARRAVGPLLTFASPDRVYATYTQVLALLFPAVFLSAWVVRSRRGDDRTRPERWGWRVMLLGYGLFGAGVLVAAVVLVDATSALLDPVFMTMMFPGLLIGLIGSTMLGIPLVRAGFRPRVTAWLLTFAIPLWVLGSFVLGHNGMGLLPLFVAWTLAARHHGGVSTAPENLLVSGGALDTPQ